MDDINFLPEDFKKREDKERRRLDSESKEQEMSNISLFAKKPRPEEPVKNPQEKIEPSPGKNDRVSLPRAGDLRRAEARGHDSPGGVGAWLGRIAAKIRSQAPREPARILEERVVERRKVQPVRSLSQERGDDKNLSDGSASVKKELSAEMGLPAASLVKDTEGGVVVNLLPEQQVLQTQVRKNMLFAASFVGATIIMIGTGWGIIQWQKRSAEEIRTTMTAEVERMKEEGSVSVALSLEELQNIERLNLITQLLEERYVWTEWLAKVELTTLPSVSIDVKQVKDDQVSMTLIAPDWVTAAQQLRLWQEQKAWVRALRASNSVFAPHRDGTTEASAEEEEPSREENVVSFDIVMTLSSDAWKP